MSRPVQGGAILEVTAKQSMAGQTLLNVWHYRLAVSAGATVDGDAVVSEFAAGMFTGAGNVIENMRSLNSNTWSYLLTRYQWIYPTRYSAQESVAGSGIGASDSPALPVNVQASVMKNGELAGAMARGGTRYGGLTTDDVFNSNLTVLRVTQLVNLTNLLLRVTDVSIVPNALNLTPIIMHRSGPALSLNWTGGNVQTTSRVIRRRTVGLGI